MIGPGPYDVLAGAVRESTAARGVVLMVIGGLAGDGFEVQVHPNLVKGLPHALREMADKIEKDIATGVMCLREGAVRDA